MKKLVLLGLLLAGSPALQAADYKNVKALLTDFLNLKKKERKPLSYWTNELIELINNKTFIKALKGAKGNVSKLKKAFKAHSGLFDNTVKVYLLSKGTKAVEQAFVTRSKVPEQDHITLEATTVLTPEQATAVLQVLKKTAYQRAIETWCDKLLEQLDEGTLEEIEPASSDTEHWHTLQQAFTQHS